MARTPRGGGDWAASHIPNGPTADAAPMKQKHRAAMGEKIDGQKNPYGAECGPTENLIGNNSGKTY